MAKQRASVIASVLSSALVPVDGFLLFKDTDADLKIPC